MKAYVYETMYILRPDLNDEAVDGTIGKYQSMLKEQGATILETQHRGKRRLAYEIDRNREGIYIQMNYTGPGAAIAPLERAMRLSDDVIRFLTVKQETDELPETAAEVAPAADDSAAAAPAMARGDAPAMALATAEEE